VLRDDMELVYDELRLADIVVVASPVYFYGLSSSLKALIDRLHAPLRTSFNIRALGLLLVAATDIPHLFDPILMQYKMTLDFFHLGDIGTITVGGVRDEGDIIGNPALDEAYRLGKSLK
jgi:NAD(P)H-dependent FMN reductase